MTDPAELIRVAYTIVLVLITAALLWLGGRPQQIGSNRLPALLPLLSPTQGFWAQAEKKQKDDRIYLDGIKDEVNIFFDDRLVPHIYAQSMEDALYAQGYLHAKYRLFQTDLSHRSAAGRLAEILGPDLRAYDIDNIKKGIPHTIALTDKAWSKHTYSYDRVGNYCDGYNSYIDGLSRADRPIEMKLIGYAPEQWSPAKVVSIIKSMQKVLAMGNDDKSMTRTLEHIGQEKFAEYHPLFNPKTIPIIPDDPSWQRETKGAISPTADDLGHLSFPLPDDPVTEGIGSNNWVVDGTKSTTGHPILANDPHLSLTLPSVWYELHIHTPDVNAYGVSLPGVPGIVIGLNDHLAWGMTNVGHDLTDWFEMSYGDDRGAVMVDGRTERLQTTEHVLSTLGMADTTISVRSSSLGPIYESDTSDMCYAWKWIGNEIPVDDEMSVFLDFMAQTGYEGRQEILSRFIAPAQNYVYADKKGNIALDVQGKYPVRNYGEGRLVQSADSTAGAWSKWIPQRDLARSLNPAQGYLASANQRSTSDAYPYDYIGQFDDYRGRTINELLRAEVKHSAVDMISYQQSTYSLYAEEFLEAFLPLLGTVDLPDRIQQSYDLLTLWDRRFDADAVAPILFDQVSQRMYLSIWDEYAEGMTWPEDWRTIELLSEPSASCHDIVATDKVETAYDLALMALDSATVAFDDIMDSGISDYGEHKNFSIPHLARLAPYGRSNLRTGGHWSSLNSIREETSVGPSWRMVVEMGPEIKAYGIYPGGQSGNPGSPHYSDMVDDWLSGTYYELDRAADPEKLRDISSSLILKPR